MSENKKISLVGGGRLGLSFALLCDVNHYDVMVYEINQERKEQIANKTLKTSEPQIENLLSKSNLKLANSTKEIVNHSDLIFIFVATPSLESGEYDHSQVENVINHLELADCVNKTVCVCCTVMPSYCYLLQRRLEGYGINVVYNPEFIAQGSIIEGLKNADIVLIGGKPPKELLQLYKDIQVTTPIFKILSHTGAELAKIAINSFLTLKTAFANMVGDVAINLGEEYNIPSILEAIGSDKRIGNKYLKYGFPASGICLPRDIRALKVCMNDNSLDSKFLSELIVENNRHLDYLEEYYIKKNPNKDVPFIFSHITYKKGVDILTESKQLELCIELLRKGYKVNISKNSVNLQLPNELGEYFNNGQLNFTDSQEGYKVN